MTIQDMLTNYGIVKLVVDNMLPKTESQKGIYYALKATLPLMETEIEEMRDYD